MMPTVERALLTLLDQILSLQGRALTYTRDTPLLGAVAELDSMAVVSLLTAIEERFGITVYDDDVDSQTFSTVGTLTDFVQRQTMRN